MKNLLLAGLWGLLLTAPAYSQARTREISYTDYLDKVHGGWTGKALGLVSGVPKEFAEPWPPSQFEYPAQVPDHFSDRYSGDDVYVPLVFQLALKHYGIHATQEQHLSEWDHRLFTGRIWGSLQQALDHHRAGIKPPKTGLPGYNNGWNDMGSQMIADIFGWVAPGLINTAAQMSSHASDIMNAGVGSDGGIFVGALESEAFFISDPKQLVRTARSVLPSGSRFGEMIDDLLRWREEEPDWRTTRQRLAKKYSVTTNLDFTGLIQGGAVALGLLYGNGEFASRADHIHARIGYPEGPQISDPRAPEWREALDSHLAWWDRIVAGHRAAGSAVLTVTPEFGPTPYMPCLPFTGQPVTDQWAVNCHMMDMLRGRWADRV